jgi:LmbE family N-acetylglucosaminyl deacetylase
MRKTLLLASRLFRLRFLLLVPCILCLVPCTFSQAPSNWTSADMYLALRKLNVVGSVLYVAAHPDDENTRLITYFSKDRLLRTGYLSLTRGDGGQNLIGDEQGIELGLIRTQELLSARRIDGGEQFFTRAYDFGFSKTPEETFTKWDREKILSDVVWVIRKFRPDVIVTRFPTTGEGGHGHHTASAILANEAFTAAADPNRFPEQLKHVQVWQVKRVLWNVFNFGGSPAASPDLFRVDVGGYSPLLGKSYGEIAAESRSQHKSQGFGVPASRGESFESFRTTSGNAPVTDIMDGVDMTWKKVPGGESIAGKIDQLVASFDLMHPERSVEGLVTLYKTLKGLPGSYWKDQKIKEVLRLIEQCSGLFIDVTSPNQYAVKTDSARMNFSLNNRLGTFAELLRIEVDQFDSTFAKSLEKNKNFNFSKTLFVPEAKRISQPYWLENKMAEGYFNVADQALIGQPDVTPAYEAKIYISIYGELFVFTTPVKYKFTDPVKGEVYWPLAVIPSYTLRIVPELSLQDRPKGKNVAFKSSYEQLYTSYKTNNFIRPGLVRMQGRVVPIDSQLLNRETRAVSITRDYNDPVYDLKNQAQPGPNSMVISETEEFADVVTKERLHDMLSIKHDHIPAITYFKPSKAELRIFPYTIYNKKIGYIIGAGDKVPEALEQMGYDVTLLTNKELSRNNLSQFDAIITGIRAYNTNEWMNIHYDKLMKYVSDGGNLIVQYNTSNQIGPVRAKMGPYNFNISRTRVTDENAAVTFLNPKHPVLNFPNTITADDFKGWVQERSIYHAAAWDSTKYETVIAMNDPGEKPDQGSLIIAKHGKGYFTYTGLVFFRELPAGVPGAYRLLANIIALNRKKAF